MKPLTIFLLLSFSLFCFENSFGQGPPCTLISGLGCECPDGTDNCELLPDITIAETMLMDPGLNPEWIGEIHISVSTPNIGYGPLQVNRTNLYLCGTDTIESDAFLGGYWTDCPDGSSPKQLIQQKIYSKNGNAIEVDSIFAGTMTYHPTHTHMHVDSWCSFQLRSIGEGDDPFTWPIVADGEKIGFCLMDYGTCDNYDDHCVNPDGEELSSATIPNYGLGGGSYQCGFYQGISVGFVDIYHHFLDDMEIFIPEETCNGDYYLTVEVDPLNHFKEMNEDNNRVAVPITLNKQNLRPQDVLEISGNLSFCYGDSVQFNAKHGNSFEWSTGETSSSIYAKESGEYFVTVFSDCNTVVSESFYVEVFQPEELIVEPTIVCINESTLLSVPEEENVDITWYEDESGSTIVSTGNEFETPILTESTNYYVSQTAEFEGPIRFGKPYDNAFGTGGFNNPNQDGNLIFNAYQPFTLKSVLVFPDATGRERTIQLLDSLGAVIQESTVEIPTTFSHTVELDFEVPIGNNLSLQVAETDTAGLYRVNSFVEYPYSIDGIYSIIGSRFDDPVNSKYRYYYFFNWEIQEQDYICEGPLNPVMVEIDPCVGIESDFSEDYTIELLTNNGNHNFTLNINKAKDDLDKVNLSLVDISGRSIWINSSSLSIGSNSIEIPNQTLTKGLYILQTSFENSKTQTALKVLHY